MSVCMLCGSLSAVACQKTYSILSMKLHQNIEKNVFFTWVTSRRVPKRFCDIRKNLTPPLLVGWGLGSEGPKSAINVFLTTLSCTWKKG